MSRCLAQSKKKDQGQDPMDKPRNVKTEIKKAYKDWLEKDVVYVITDEERKAFKKLTTDEEREAFIEEFWRRRDPDPDTDENEFKEEYYERIAYANEHLPRVFPVGRLIAAASGSCMASPTSVRHIRWAARMIDLHRGRGSTSTYPFEDWFYRYIAGVGSGVEIELSIRQVQANIASRAIPTKRRYVKCAGSRSHALGTTRTHQQI